MSLGMRPSHLLLSTAALLLCSLFQCRPVAADYVLTSIQSTAYGWEGALKVSTPGPFSSSDIPALQLSVWFETSERLRVTLRDGAQQRWEIPSALLHIDSTQPPQSAPLDALYDFSYTDTPFGFAITRKSTGAVLFNTSGQPLFYSSQYLQIGTALPADYNVYGLGERIVPFRLPQDDYTIWDTDWGNPTVLPLYGHHPIYHRVEDTGDAHAVIFWNSNMMDVNLSSSALTYRTIGGVLDFYFLLGPEPLTLTTQYTDMVGRPFMPPLWSMGWHQCKWGYPSANYTLQVVLNYTAADIPLDVIWNDIDWMRDYVAFTYNDELGSGGYTAKDVRALNDYLAANQQYHVHIVDPNIPVILVDKDKQPYLPYVNGKTNNLYVRHPANDTFLFGTQWPPMTVVWPDWTHPDITSWWEDNFRRFGDIAGQLDGVWLDMNEPSNFCNGQISQDCNGQPDSNRQLDPIAVPHPPVSSPTDIPLPPYEPNLASRHIESNSFNISSNLYLGQSYNVKDMWGMMEQRATATAMANIHKTRPFTLSRSTFMGSGSWGAHWLGDNGSNWDDLRRSIAEVLSMGLYGITMVGADICGFGGDTDAELCARWIQLGSLYPFSRDHSAIGTKDQEAYRFAEPYLSLNRNSIKLRYSLLPYFYQLFVDSHLTG